MNIWIFNNYNMLPEQGGLNRHYYFGTHLKQMGHAPIVFVGSHPHNTDIQLIEGAEKYKVLQVDPFPWVLIKTLKYGKSRKKQVLSMLQFYHNGKKAARYIEEHYGRPNVILGSSAHPLAAVLAVVLSKKYHCRSVVEIRDLWPESIVAYGIAGPHNPAIIALRQLEKWIYKKADAIVFTMEGAYDYIVEQGWEKEIPRSKVFYINNGVDLEQFDYNRVHFRVEDPDLENPDFFTVVYTGSVRRVNDLGALLDAAKRVEDPAVRFLIWGDGDELPALRQRVQQEGIRNVVFKGKVEKKYIPSIVSRANANLIHGGLKGAALLRYGISANKMFDCFAAGKPILSDLPAKYDPVQIWHAGITVRSAAALSDGLRRFQEMSGPEQEDMCGNARRAAENYDFKRLTERLLNVIRGDGR